MLSLISRSVSRLPRCNKGNSLLLFIFINNTIFYYKLGVRNASIATKTEEQVPAKSKTEKDLLHYRFIYPEFLPDPKIEFRNVIREKLERQDMLNHRNQIDIPEFYVGE